MAWANIYLLTVSGNKYSVVVVAGCLLLAVQCRSVEAVQCSTVLPVYVYSEDGVAAATVFVHVVSSDGAVLQSFLQHSQQVVQLSALNTGLTSV